MRARHFLLAGLLVGVTAVQAAAQQQPAGGSAAPAGSGSAAPPGAAAPAGSAAPAATGSASAAALPPPPPAAPPGSARPGPAPPAPPPPRSGPPQARPGPGYPPPPAYGQRGGYPPSGYGYGYPPYYAPVEPPPPAKPKGVHLHDGFYFRADLGFGYMHESATFKFAGTSASQTQAGGAGSMLLLFGGTPATGFVIGGGLVVASAGNLQASGDTTSVRGKVDSESLTGLTGFADYFIDPKAGFHVLALLGYGGLSWVDNSGTQASGNAQPDGLLIGGGVGYDFWVGDQWSLGVLGRVVYAPLSTHYTLDTSLSTQSVSYSSDVLVPTLAFTVLCH